jgi:hypothetical protein
MEMVVDINGGIGWGGEYKVMAVAECFVPLHKWGQQFSAKSSQLSFWGSVLGAPMKTATVINGGR